MTKKDPKFKLTLSAEQKIAKQGIYDKDVSVILGKQGSGKTLLAVLTALDMLLKKHNGIDKIIITRPIMNNKIGFLPGSVGEKLQPWIQPIKQCMYMAYHVEAIDKLFEENIIQILPIDFMKGVTFTHAVTIVDEFQDLNYDDFILSLSRLGRNSKLIYCGSKEQVDNSMKKYSCMDKVSKLADSDLVNWHILNDNHRNDIIFKIIEYIEK